MQEAWLRLSGARSAGCRRDRQPRRVADHGGGPDLPEHLARPPGPSPRRTRRPAAGPDRRRGRGSRSRASGDAGRRGGIGVVRDFGHVATGRAPGVRPARRVRRPVRPDRAHRRAVAGGHPQAGQPGAAAHPAGRASPGYRPGWPSAPSSTPSSPPDVPATSTGWCRCWTPTCRCAATSAPARPDSARYTGHPLSPRWPGATPRPNAKSAPAVVNGAAGAVIFVDGRPTAIMGFVVRGGRIAAIDVLADPARIARIDFEL